jgi:hypothetical protein
MPTLWSLAEHLAQTSRARLFAVPLASAVPDGTKPVGDFSKRAVPFTRFTVADLPDTATPNVETKSKTFSIVIDAGPGFTPEPEFPTLPDPAIRLHAMTTAFVRFRTADQALVFETFIFGVLTAKDVPWWQRWRDARKIPKEIAFLNVDLEDLRARIRNGTGVEVMPGLSIPPLRSDAGEELPVDAAQRQRFADGFFAGTDPQFTLVAQAGAVMGQAGLSGAGPNRELRLQVRYADHTDSKPQPMNPRELLYLMFGDVSTVATTHPVLQAMEKSVPPTAPRNTKQMILRPPLRTWRRLMWEAELEETHRAVRWADASGLPAGTVFNPLRREKTAGEGFVGIGYAEASTVDKNKCNILTPDLAVRAGFMVAVQPIQEPAWHYVDAGSYANLARNAQIGAGRAVTPAPVPIKGGGSNRDDKDVVWGMTYGQKISAGMTAAEINALIHDEGRCLVVAMMRPSRFEISGNPGYVTKASCELAFSEVNSGHMVLVREVLANPVLTRPVDPRLLTPAFQGTRVIRSLSLRTAGAFSDGAHSNAPWQPTLNGRAGGSSSNLAGIRIELFELMPGGDPDTIQGALSLNVRQPNPNRMNTADEAAVTRRRGANGPCCFDRPGTGVVEDACPTGFTPP